MDNKEELICSILERLTETPEEGYKSSFYQPIINDIIELYRDDYRHQYSIIMKIIASIHEADKGEEKLQKIIYNLGYLYNSLESSGYQFSNLNDFEKLKKSLYKFRDHVNLEVARIEYTRGMIERQNANNRQLFADIENQKRELRTFNMDLSSTKKAMEKTNIDIIGIASLIFSAFTLITTNVSIFSAISSRTDLSIIKILAIAVLFNLIVVSAVFVIFKMVRASSRINESRNIGIYVGVFIGISILLILLLIILASKFNI